MCFVHFKLIVVSLSLLYLNANMLGTVVIYYTADIHLKRDVEAGLSVKNTVIVGNK